MKLYRLLNYLSIDVACGAMVCSAFFARILQVQLRPYGIASLGITVWIIYTSDHLMDAHKLRREASTERHRFHQKNFRLLLAIVMIAVVVDFILILFVRLPILYTGIGLSILVLFYLLLQQRLALFKELVTAILYSGGIILPSLSLTSIPLSGKEILLVSSFLTTAFINLILFSWFGWEEDVRDEHPSLVTFLGRRAGQKLLRVLFLVQVVLFAGLAATGQTPEGLVLFIMNMVLLVLFVAPHRFFKSDLYRLIGDIVFLFPFPYLFL